MTCIYCHQTVPLSDSHVISKFLRKRLTGIDRGAKGTKYEFRWRGQAGITQDLPKPKLMCSVCDGGFTAEGRVPQFILPKGDLTDPGRWATLPLHDHVLPVHIAGAPMIVQEYQLDDAQDECDLDQFSVLTAWRALHAMAHDLNPDAVNFLQSTDGVRTDAATIAFLRQAQPGMHRLFPYLAKLYFLGPCSAAAVTGADDTMPFAWTFLQGEKQCGIAVVFAFWMIVWPLLPDNDSRRDSNELSQLAFVDWHAKLIAHYRKSA